MPKFLKNQTLTDFQNIIQEIYGLPDDRLFSVNDLLSNQNRFTMRALKGIRKQDLEKIKTNLCISFSWTAAIANRMHIVLEKVLWQRFPYLCSYCGRIPCVCRKNKVKKRVKILRQKVKMPKNITEIQLMFAKIYPPTGRSLADAGVHLAEETGEVSEIICAYLGEHKNKQFEEIKNELADWISCLFGVANSAKIDMAKELAKFYKNNCHVCHKAPCVCNFSFVAKFRS
jgi:NTP pyrophosphatase (non-canonical NTP hydrolase)